MRAGMGGSVMLGARDQKPIGWPGNKPIVDPYLLGYVFATSVTCDSVSSQCIYFLERLRTILRIGLRRVGLPSNAAIRTAGTARDVYGLARKTRVQN